MNRSWVSVLGLLVMLVATGCGSDGGRRDSTDPERTSTSPTSPTVEPSQDVETSLDALTKDALSLHPQARLINRAKGPEARARATYFETSSDTNLGALVMPATLSFSAYAGSIFSIVVIVIAMVLPLQQWRLHRMKPQLPDLSVPLAPAPWRFKKRHRLAGPRG